MEMKKEMVDFISIQIGKNEILYDSKVRKTKSSNGIIRLKQPIDEAYVIFPIYRKERDGEVVIAIDEIIRAKFSKEDEREVYSAGLHRRYTGRKCVVINASNPITIELEKREIIFNGSVRKTYSGQGIIRVKDKYLGNRVYAIMPLFQKPSTSTTTIGIGEIFNLGVHPDNDHMGCCLFSQKDTGKDCVIILQEG